MTFDLRSVLASPRMYELLQWMMGSSRGRPIFAREYVAANPGDRVLDIGCGPSGLLEYLPDVTYLGFDMSPDYIAYAKRRYGSRGRFYCERVRPESVKGEEPFDIVIASEILHHLSDEEGLDLFELARSCLKPTGRLVTLDAVYIEKQSPIARFIIDHDRGEHVRGRAAYEELARRVFSKVQTSIRTDLQSFSYTHIIMECSP
jgi:cyclopropane fatty-acyl-phospholipid synthase-like methyltransferase